MKQPMQVLTSSESKAWNTPSRYAEMARDVMGSIDLDPASSKVANEIIKATHYYTKQDDGLRKTWEGNVFVNPPYGRVGNLSSQDVWMDEAYQRYWNREIDQAIVLTNARPGYVWWDNWFHRKWTGCVCLTEGRISFWQSSWYKDGQITPPNGASAAKTASCFWYLGEQITRFTDIFSDIGMVFNLRKSRTKE